MTLDRSAPPPYEAGARASLAAYLPTGQGFRPTLCVSDTHLLAEDEDTMDLPERFLELLEWYGDYQLFVLGDLMESLVYSDTQISGLRQNRRLRAILSELRLRPNMRLVPGNHDVRAMAFLRSYLGADRVFFGGFRVGRIVFVHGHEHGLDASPVAERYTGLVPVGHALNHLGFQPRIGIASNNDIAALYAPMHLFPIFGHTHDPVVTPLFANTGCFLQSAASFITLIGDEMTLWMDHT